MRESGQENKIRNPNLEIRNKVEILRRNDQNQRQEDKIRISKSATVGTWRPIQNPKKDAWARFGWGEPRRVLRGVRVGETLRARRFSGT